MKRASELTGICGGGVEIRDGRCDVPSYAADSGIRISSWPSWEAWPQGMPVPASMSPEGDGVFIDIPAGACVAEPFCVSFAGGGSSCVGVYVREGASAELVFLFSDGASAERVFLLEKGASVRIKEIVAASEDISVESALSLDEGARAEIVTVELGSAGANMKYAASMRGRDAQTVHAGLFMAAEGERKAMDIRIEHLVPDCRSDVMIKGVASGTGFGSFAGIVYVAPDAQHTEAYQQSRNLIMGPHAKIVTEPQLEIYADDVKCSHGATVGQMNDDAVYYMRQRGLSEAEARGLQLTGFVNDIISRLGEGELADRVLVAAQDKIGRLQRDV